MHGPRPLLIALLLLAVVGTAAFLLWSRGGTPAIDPLAASAGGPGAAAATAARADASAAALQRQEAATAPDPSRLGAYTVTGRVLPIGGVAVAGARVLARQGQPGDRSNDNSMFGMMGQGMRGRDGKQPDMPMLQRGDVIATAAVVGDGTFELRADERHLRLSLDHDHYGLANSVVVHVPEAGKRTHVVLTPFLGACIRGRLVGDDAAGVDDVRLSLEFDQLAMMRNPASITAAIGQSVREPVHPGADGAFLFRAVLADGNANLMALGARATGRLRVAALQPGETREVALPVVAAASIEAEIADDLGKPLAGATVGAEPLDLGSDQMGRALARREATTDATGKCTVVGLFPGRYRVRSQATGFAPAESDVVVSSGHPVAVRLQMQLGGAVEGAVVDDTGAPIAAARVAHFPAISVPLLGDISEQMGLDIMVAATRGNAAVTDEHGHFRLAGIEDEGAFFVVAAHDGFAGGVAKNVKAGARDVQIALQKAAVVTGHAVAAEDRKPLTAFQVEAQLSMFLGMKRTAHSEPVSNDDGAFRLELSPGSITLALRADDRAEVKKDVVAVAGKTLDVGTIELPHSCRIRGRVVGADGQPVRGALVRQKQGGMLDNAVFGAIFGGNQSARADDLGRFELADLPPGKPILLASADGYATGRSDRLQLAAGQTLDDITIELGHGGGVQGRVVTESGDRPDEFTVIVKEQQTQSSRTITPSADGAFRADDLDPGQYEVQAMHPSAMAAITRSQTDWRPGKSFKLGEMIAAITDAVVTERCVVRSGEVTKVTLDASQLGAGTRLTLQVLIGDKPLTTGIVEATAVDDGLQKSGFVQDGATTIGGLRPGRFRLQVRGGITLAPIGNVQDVAIAAGESNHREVLRLPGGELRGRVSDAGSGDPLANVLVRLLAADASAHSDSIGVEITDTRGEFAFRGLQDGSYSLVAADESTQRSGDGAASRQDGLRVAGGQGQTGIELRAQPAAGVTAMCTDDSGAPVAGAMLLCVDPDGRPIGGFGAAISGADGRGHFGGLPRGLLRVVGRAPGRAPGASEVVEAQPGQVVEPTVQLTAGTRVVLQCKGRDGKDLAGVDVSARCNSGPWFPALLLLERRAADGGVELGRLGAGNWEFRISHPAVGTFTVRRSVGGSGTVTILAMPE